MVGRLRPGASRTGTAPIASAISARCAARLLVALDGDRRAVEGRERPVEVRERDERVERAGLRPGRHRRLEHLRPSSPLVWIIACPAYSRRPRRAARDDVVGDGEDHELDIVDDGVRLGEGADAGHELAEPLAAGRVARRDGADRPAGPRARRQAVPTAPAPTIPTHRSLARRARGRGRCVRDAPWSCSSCRGRVAVCAPAAPAGAVRVAGSRSMPCVREVLRSVSFALVGARSAWRSRATSSVSSQALTGPRCAATGDRRRAVCFHPTSVPTERLASRRAPSRARDAARWNRDAWPRPTAFGARASLGAPASPTSTGSSALVRRRPPGHSTSVAPVTLKILLENVLRHAGGGHRPRGRRHRARRVATGRRGEAEVPFMPGRVVLQDFTGVPAVVDLAAMRDAMAALGGDPVEGQPARPGRPRDRPLGAGRPLGRPGAFAFNVEREYERNGERYQLLRWAQTAFRDLRVVPPGTGIVHQVNLEYLATVVTDREDDGGRVAFPDTLVGTDSHTTMINGLGVLGYGVGGIEAEAVLLGQPLYQPMPRIVGVRLTGELPRGATATDLVLVVTEMLRSFGVVGAFVEFAGDGLAGCRSPTGRRSPT